MAGKDDRDGPVFPDYFNKERKMGKDYVGESIFANYFRGIEGVGGKIHFDENGMTFKAHKINIQTSEMRIEYGQIVRVARRNTFGIVPNGMSVVTQDGFGHKFVVYHRSDIIQFLETKKYGAAQ